MPPLDSETDYRMRMLVTLIRSTDCLSLALSTWLGMQGHEGNGVMHRLVRCRPREVTVREAEVLEVDPGSVLDYRQGELWAGLNGIEQRLAVVNGLVVTSRLPQKARDMLTALPLGLVLQQFGGRRQTDPPIYERVTAADGEHRLVARLSATLLVGGRPWALTDEEVDQLVVTHRVPGPAVLGRVVA